MQLKKVNRSTALIGEQHQLTCRK